jgi:hypothetical protein
VMTDLDAFSTQGPARDRDHRAHRPDGDQG